MCSFLLLADAFTKRTNSHLVNAICKSEMGLASARCNLLWMERNPPWERFSGGSGRPKTRGIEVQIFG